MFVPTGGFVESILESCKAAYERNPRPFGIAKVILDDEGNPKDAIIVYLNQAMAKIANCEPESLVGKNVYETWPDGNKIWLDFFYRAAYLDEPAEFETVNVAYRAFQNVSIFPVMEGYCAYEVQDVTQWLAYSHPVMKNVSAGMFFYEEYERKLFLTDPARDCCGLDTGYIDLDEFADRLFSGEDASLLRDALGSKIVPGKELLLDLELKNGKWIRLSLTKPLASDRFAIGLLEDISLLREAEQSSLKRSEIIESLSLEYHALYLLDLGKNALTAYLQREDLGAIPGSDIGGDCPYSEWLDSYCERYVAESDRARAKGELSLQNLREHFSKSQKDMSIVYKRRFGDEDKYLELRLTRVGSNPEELVLAARNINDEMENQINQKEVFRNALAIAQNANHAKTVFLTNISHDFRTPLNSIIGFSNLALSHLDDPERVRNGLEKIVMSSEHLMDLINDLLDVSRIESGKLVLEESPLDIKQLADEIGNVFAVDAAKRGINFSVDASSISHAMVLGDRLRINQILVNTIGNAIKYTSQGGNVEVIISEGQRKTAGTVVYEVVVKDDGCGMSKDFIEHIFEPFERDSNKMVQGVEGTGLGMTITKNLVDLIGGSITVRSELGEGSEFTILLPLKLYADGDSGVDDNGSLTHESELERHEFDGFRALIVDDDDLSREMLGEILKDHGFMVDQAADGQEALDAFCESEDGYYDVLILDMRMPRMTGDEAAMQIRNLSREDVETIPIIALSADAYEEGYRRSKTAGMTEHITKPLNTRRLLAVLSDCLKR